MDIADVMDQVASALDTIPNLRVNEWPGGHLVPPAAWVQYPDSVVFDETYGRGMDRITMSVVVAIGVPTERATRDLVTAYCAGSGSSSVKAAIEGASYSALHTIRVTQIDFAPTELAGITHQAAVFELDITGQGTA